MIMPVNPESINSLPYDWNDKDSILRYAAHLSNRTLRDFVEYGQIIIGGTRTKGFFGQILETDYFHLTNNSQPVPDFDAVGMELKSTPIKETSHGLVPKERLVLCIIDFNEVPEKGFDLFLDKNSHILIIFYLWKEGQDVYDYRILKVVDWKPSESDLRIIKEDWDVIEGYILRGEAHLLSERHTKFLAACTKGAGHGADMRTQPFSDVPAKQRALSFKPAYMASIFNTWPDINELLIDEVSNEEEDDSIFSRPWDEGTGFEEYVLDFFDEFVGLTCEQIEIRLCLDLNENSKQYYHSLVMAMLGMGNSESVREFDQADIKVKTIRIRQDWKPKESMSFPAFRYEELVEQTWETSDFYEQIDREFLFPVFQFNTSDPKGEARKDLVFIGAFFWSVPDEDMPVIGSVWNDTKEKVLAEDFDHFVKKSDDRITHVRPHGRNSKDTYPFRGEEHVKRCFWFNDTYIGRIVIDNLRD